MKLLKHISTAFFLVLLMLPFVTPAVLQLQQLYVQWEMLEAFEEKELIAISVDANEVQWIHKGKECIINGEMFDVKETKEKNNQLLLTGLFDKKEKEIKARIAKQAKEEKRNERAGRWLKLFQINSIVSTASLCIEPIPCISANRSNKYQLSLYTSPFTGVVIPPPKNS